MSNTWSSFSILLDREAIHDLEEKLMKFRRKITLGILLYITLCSAAFAQPVQIPDHALRTQIEIALELAPGTRITRTDMSHLDALDLQSQGITSLNGLEFATELTFLVIAENPTIDLTPVSELSQMLELLKHDQTAWVGVETFAEMRDGAPRHHYIEQHFMPVHVIPIDFYGNLSARLNYSHPLPGTLIAAFLASTPASRIYVTGCPCYQDKSGKTEHAKLQIMGQHQTITDFHYLRQLIQRDERFTCDPIMESLFHTEVS